MFFTAYKCSKLRKWSHSNIGFCTQNKYLSTRCSVKKYFSGYPRLRGVPRLEEIIIWTNVSFYQQQ